MTSIEQKLLDKFRDASLNFSMKDNKIQNEFGNNICKFLKPIKQFKTMIRFLIY